PPFAGTALCVAVHKEEGRLATAFLCCFLPMTYWGTVTVVMSRTTADCASSLPLIDERLPNVIPVWPRTIPSKCVPAPMVTAPETCQKTFWGRAPPVRMTFLLVAMSSVPATWKIQTSVALPLRVRSVVMVTALPQVYVPGARV